MSTSSPALVTITSFGYGHPIPAPQADLTIDARRHLRNPHEDPAMRELTGLNAAVRRHVINTPGALFAVEAAVAFALGMLVSSRGQTVTVATGCVGGRHRAPALAEEIAQRLRDATIAVLLRHVDIQVEHRDIQRPVIQK